MSLGLIVVGIYANMQSNLKEVNIIDNGELITFTTHGQTVIEVLQEAEVRVGNFDEMNVDLEQEVYDGMEIEINRAQQVVINDGGLRSLVMTTESTVDELLNERDIEISSDDELSVAPTAYVRDGMEIDLTRVEYLFEEEYEEIHLPTHYVETEELLKGEREVRTEGTPRIIQRTMKSTLKNGELVTTDESEIYVVDEGVREVIAVGTKEMVIAPVVTLSTPASTPTPKPDTSDRSSFTVNVTAYVADCPGCTGRVACTGRDVSSDIYYSDKSFGTVRIVAAGSDYPCGTILDISDVGTAIVLDRGGKVTGNIVDLLVDENKTNPWHFGRRSLEARVLRTGW